MAVRRDQVYFAFASGRFSYDCVTCQAKCCRGYAYELPSASELQRHLSVRPAVRFFVDAIDDDPAKGYGVKNCPPSCFFLTANNHCAIHAELGYSAKPETCRLFPFNNFKRVGRYLVVAPHVGLCPLEIMEEGRVSDHSDHGVLLAAMADQGIAVAVPEVHAAYAEVSALLALERSIVDLSERSMTCGDYRAFAVAQQIATQQALDRVERSRVDDLSTRAETAALHAFQQEVHRVLGTSPPREPFEAPGLVRTLVACTPVLRSQLLFQRAVPGKEQTGVSVDRIPRLLLALHGMATLAVEAGMTSITYQTLTRLLTDCRALLVLLAHVDCAMVWKPDVPIDMTFKGEDRRRYIDIVRALLPRQPKASATTLGEILCEHISEDGVERTMFLRCVARRLAGRIEPVADLRGRAPHREVASHAQALS